MYLRAIARPLMARVKQTTGDVVPNAREVLIQAVPEDEGCRKAVESSTGQSFQICYKSLRESLMNLNLGKDCDSKLPRDLRNKYPGLDWRLRLQNLVPSTKIEKNPDCAKFRKHGIPPKFEAEAKLDRMHLDISATGQHAYVPSSGLPLPRIPKQRINEDFIESSDDSDEVHPKADGSSKRKRKSSTVEKSEGSVQKTGKVGSATILAKKIDRMCEVIESMSTSTSMISKSAVCADISIKEVMKVVTSLPGVEPGSRLHFFATQLFLNQEKREMFCTMEDPTIKFEWLKFEMSEK